MLDDSPRTIYTKKDEKSEDTGNVIHRKLKTKEDIKNYVKTMI